MPKDFTDLTVQTRQSPDGSVVQFGVDLEGLFVPLAEVPTTRLDGMLRAYQDANPTPDTPPEAAQPEQPQPEQPQPPQPQPPATL